MIRTLENQIRVKKSHDNPPLKKKIITIIIIIIIIIITYSSYNTQSATKNMMFEHNM
jgi:hypothetical protein